VFLGCHGPNCGLLLGYSSFDFYLPIGFPWHGQDFSARNNWDFFQPDPNPARLEKCSGIDTHP
jgi:hypothetical protein